MNERAKYDSNASTYSGKSDGGKTCAKAFVQAMMVVNTLCRGLTKSVNSATTDAPAMGLA